MTQKSREIIGTAVAIAVILGTISSIGHSNERKNNSCCMAKAATISANEYALDNDFTIIDNVIEVDTTSKGSLFSEAKAAYVMENSTKTPVFEKGSLKKLPIASMCKIMTLLLTFESIDQGILTKDELIRISENAASMGGSQVFLEENASYPLNELIKSIVVCSANDSCVAVAERICGNTDIFVEKMNERAKELGCENTLFANCTGLPKEPQYSCAEDVALMMSELLKPEDYFTYGKIWLDTFQHPQGRTTEITNTNRLVKFYDGCDGGKTGFTNEAGFCLAATAKRGDMRLISVVIGEKDSKTRFKEVSESFDYTFANYSIQKVVDSTILSNDTVSVAGGKSKYLVVKPERDGVVFAKRGEIVDVETKFCLDSLKKAPIQVGEVVGKVLVFKNGIEIDKIPIVAAENIEKANYWDSIIDTAKDWNFSGK